jgi:gamma-glutamyl-gamma-aminobutyrate hydrolase PuuD
MSLVSRAHNVRPLVGVSASSHDFGDYGGVGIQRVLFDAGALPLTLAQLPVAIDDALDRVDALVLAPGRDIAPERYGQDPDPLLAPTAETSSSRRGGRGD